MLGVKWHYYVENCVFFRDTGVPTVTELITKFSNRYMDRLLVHSNRLARRLATHLGRRRLRRRHPADLWILGRDRHGRQYL